MDDSPLYLNADGREFWTRHHDRLRSLGVLTDADVDAFGLTCFLWQQLVALSVHAPGASTYREMVQLNNLSKQFHAFAKQFGLMPAARRGAKMPENTGPKTDEFGL